MSPRTLALLSLAAFTVAAHADLSYPHFTTTTGLTLNGNATSVGGALRLTEAQNWQDGSAWSDAGQSILTGFDTSFTYHIGEGNNADGLTFALQDHGLADLGGDGGSLGFNGITSVFGVQFRTYDHNKIQIGSFTDTPIASVDNTGLRGDHSVRITYVPGTMTVYLDGSLAVSGAVDLTGRYAGNSPYVGFTAATGGSTDVHAIRNWAFTSGPPQAVPEPASMAALGLGALGLFRRRKNRLG